MLDCKNTKAQAAELCESAWKEMLSELHII